MTNGSTESAATPTKATSTRPGNPPRWLVVVLMLAIVGGVAIQWQTKQTHMAVSTAAEPYLDLRWRDMIPESHYPPNWGIFSHASFAVDAETNRVWLLTSDRSAKPGVLLISSSPDGGDSWYTPVDAALQLPKLAELEGHLHRTTDGTLYITASGRAKPGGTLTAAVLRSTDDGAHWAVWQRLPASIASITPVASIRYAASDEALYLVGLQAIPGGGTELAVYQTDLNEAKSTVHVLASYPARSSQSIASVLPTAEGLFVAALVKQRRSNWEPWIAHLDSKGQVATPMQIPLSKSYRPLFPTLMQSEQGEIMALVPALVLPKAPSKPFSFRLSGSQGLQLVPQYPEWEQAPTRLWQWDRVTGQWTPLGDDTHRPQSHGTFFGLSDGLAIKPDPLREQGIPGFRFHQITTTPPFWTGQALVRGPAATDADLLDSALMKDGEVLLLVHEHTHTNRDLLFLWRTASLTPFLNATETP